jgi:(p)ppGpp synthase/HD superfamily hydrolase
VDGHPVRLNTPLATGQRVEIVAGKFEAPDRAWLDSRLGFVRTARAREKIQAWFRDRPEYENRAFGITLIADMMERLGVVRPDKAALEVVAMELGFAGEDELTAALAIGDCQVSDVVGALHGDVVQGQLSLLPQDDAAQRHSYSLSLEARDRDGLLKDVTTLLSEEDVSILASISRQDAKTGLAMVSLELQMPSLQALALIIEQLMQVPDVLDVRRTVS